ncbi:MAG TPA: alpha/beta hydrolase [Paraburkholderia sp.]|nr:alpha/beta hydrolase [Paraburkholderia sp.]
MLEPEIAAFVERTDAMYPAGTASLPAAEQRAIYDRYAAAFTPPLPAGLRVENASFRARMGHLIPLRLYRPVEAGGPSGTVLYFHGGGFVMGSLDSHEIVTARLAADAGLCVIAVDYRLAPEHRAPAAHDDCLEVTLAALEGGLPFASLPAPLQLAGDSAGGNLAASVAMQLRDRGIDGVRGIALVYPMLGAEPQSPARETEAHAPMLTLADVHAFRDIYWGEKGGDMRGGTPVPQWTLPLHADRFDGLPATLAVGVEHDPLRDDAQVFAQRIQAADGQAEVWMGEGLVHGCWRALATSPGVQSLHDTVCRFLLHTARTHA